ncbi:MAG: hypothetical protein GXP54_12965 [Deltaproteobacteria bacterium]|nr:hypothetical protein [Deltaproteobacteria bacterium]
MKPSPFQIFCGYYLGLGLDWEYRFFNQHSLAAHFGIDHTELVSLMVELRMSPEDTRHMDFNIARAHANAQVLSMDGKRSEVESFARETFDAFLAAMDTYDPERVFENIDYDDIFADKKKG